MFSVRSLSLIHQLNMVNSNNAIKRLCLVTSILRVYQSMSCFTGTHQQLSADTEHCWPCKVIFIELKLFLDKSVAVQDALESGKSATVSRSHRHYFIVLHHTTTPRHLTVSYCGVVWMCCTASRKEPAPLPSIVRWWMKGGWW